MHRNTRALLIVRAAKICRVDQCRARGIEFGHKGVATEFTTNKKPARNRGVADQRNSSIVNQPCGIPTYTTVRALENTVIATSIKRRRIDRIHSNVKDNTRVQSGGRPRDCPVGALKDASFGRRIKRGRIRGINDQDASRATQAADNRPATAAISARVGINSVADIERRRSLWINRYSNELIGQTAVGHAGDAPGAASIRALGYTGSKVKTDPRVDRARGYGIDCDNKSVDVGKRSLRPTISAIGTLGDTADVGRIQCRWSLRIDRQSTGSQPSQTRTSFAGRHPGASSISASVNTFDGSGINLGWVYRINCHTDDKGAGGSDFDRSPGVPTIVGPIARAAANLPLQRTHNWKVPGRRPSCYVSIAERVDRDARAILVAAAAKICGVDQRCARVVQLGNKDIPALGKCGLERAWFYGEVS